MPYFLVTTRAEIVESLRQELGINSVVMLGSSISNWRIQSCDWHFTNYKIENMALPYQPINKNYLLCTAQYDLPACVAAAYFLTLRYYEESNENEGNFPMDTDYVSKLRAISWQCNRLFISNELSAYTTFAARVITAMSSQSQKAITSLNINDDSKTLTNEERDNSMNFYYGTMRFIDAIYGIRPWPGVK